MSTTAPEGKEWEMTFQPGGGNELAFARLIEVKGELEAAGAEFPTTLIIPLLAGERAMLGNSGMRVVITLSQVRDDTARTLTVHSGVTLMPVATAEGEEPVVTMSARMERHYGPRAETVESILAHLAGKQVAETDPAATRMNEERQPDTERTQ